jgi:hypothetical protein
VLVGRGRARPTQRGRSRTETLAPGAFLRGLSNLVFDPSGTSYPRALPRPCPGRIRPFERYSANLRRCVPPPRWRHCRDCEGRWTERTNLMPLGIKKVAAGRVDSAAVATLVGSRSRPCSQPPRQLCHSRNRPPQGEANRSPQAQDATAVVPLPGSTPRAPRSEPCLLRSSRPTRASPRTQPTPVRHTSAGYVVV